MTREQAKEILEKWKYRGSDGLTDERLGYIDEWYHKKDDVAFEIAIKSLDMWNKVIEEIENLTYYWCEVNPKSVIDDVLQIIEKYKKEIEE